MERGVTQGDVDSPTIFNLIIDAVLRKIKRDINFGKSTMSFYADDGLVENSDSESLQRDVDELVCLFAKFGLESKQRKDEIYGSERPSGSSSTESHSIQ